MPECGSEISSVQEQLMFCLEVALGGVRGCAAPPPSHHHILPTIDNHRCLVAGQPSTPDTHVSGGNAECVEGGGGTPRRRDVLS